ncbi:MAG: hypothetical protein EB069_01905 [Actinobacteria bacterium]|nr:hypothetical protein [Actinomycetota bacterium]
MPRTIPSTIAVMTERSIKHNKQSINSAHPPSPTMSAASKSSYPRPSASLIAVQMKDPRCIAKFILVHPSFDWYDGRNE